MDKSGEYGKLISSFDQMRNGKKRLLEAHRASEKIRDQILGDLRSDIEESSIISINERKKGNKKTKRANDPISKVLKANKKAFMFQREMNDLLLKILERYELDKPILMADKLDIIWDKTSKKLGDSTDDKKKREDPEAEFDRVLVESKLTGEDFRKMKEAKRKVKQAFQVEQKR